MIQTERRSRRPNSSPAPTASQTVRPALDSGDVMARSEFERRYGLRPDLKKAELVDGVVHVSSPARDPHGTATAFAVAWLATYKSRHANVAISDNGTVRLSGDTEVQPDVLLRLLPESGGQTVVDDDGFVAGAPELVFEVAYSSASRDLNAKKRAYERAGVREYVVWQLEDAVIDWFALIDGAFVARTMDDDGMIESAVFPGLRLDVRALLAGDLARVMQVVSGA